MKDALCFTVEVRQGRSGGASQTARRRWATSARIRSRRSNQASKRARCGPRQLSETEVVSLGGRRGRRSRGSGCQVLEQRIDSRVEALSADTVAVTTASLRSDRNFVRLVRVAKRRSEGAAAQKSLWVRQRRAVQIGRATRGVRHSVPRPLQTETRTGSVD